MDTNERFYDPEIHEIASYQDANGMAKGLLLKTVKKGFKYKDEVIKKPRVVVTK
jgi:molecular chaperone GrpE (heat shock protein)